MNGAIYGWAFYGLVLKQVRRFMRGWVKSLLPSVITASLFMLIFGKLVGRNLGEVEGLAYADFIMPGLVMFAVVTNAYNNTTLAFYGARRRRSLMT